MNVEKKDVIKYLSTVSCYANYTWGKLPLFLLPLLFAYKTKLITHAKYSSYDIFLIGKVSLILIGGIAPIEV